MFYLKKLLIDKTLLTQGRFLIYNPIEHGSSLMLDGQTLQNLEILENNVDRGTRGTLFELLCHCRSPYGMMMKESILMGRGKLT